MSVEAGPQTWKEVVREALVELGGEAHLRQINAKIKGHPKTHTNPTWEDTIRRVVRQYTIFEPVPPSRSGIYKLVEKDQAGREFHPGQRIEKVDHASAQGMLLALGRLYGYETFAPANDRTARTFQEKPLDALTTVRDCKGFCTPRSEKRVRQIDTLWLAEDNDGPYPVYAFEVEHTTGVRSGMDRLIEIPDRFKTHLFVIAPGHEEQERFSSLRDQNRFCKFRERMHFRDYSQLATLYGLAEQHEKDRDSFGVSIRWSTS